MNTNVRFRELIVDSFAGGGGTSLGIEMALGRSPDIAINHNESALSMHRANHPKTIHLNHDVWKIDPVKATNGFPVGLMWASPDCRHFSRAASKQPLSHNTRDLAWVVVKWASIVRPRVIILENVEEFRTWGPLVNGRPCPIRKGETFQRWVIELQKLGYEVDWRDLRACAYGAPTIRKRFFLIARCDGRPIVWPDPTHGDPNSVEVKTGKLKPWRTAAEIIDWLLPTHSIFMSKQEARAFGIKRPLVDATMARIAKGVRRYVMDTATPFIVPNTCGISQIHDKNNDPNINRLILPHISRQFGASIGSAVTAPLGTVTAGGGGKSVLVSAFFAQHNGGNCPGSRPATAPVSTITLSGSQQAIVSAGLLSMKGSDRRSSSIYAPHPTVTAQGCHSAEVRALLTKYNGKNQTLSPIITINGSSWLIEDIFMRMLSVRELYRAQGFPDTYEIKYGHDGRVFTQAESIRMCGNSVSPMMAKALVGANYIPNEGYLTPSITNAVVAAE